MLEKVAVFLLSSDTLPLSQFLRSCGAAEEADKGVLLSINLYEAVVIYPQLLMIP